MEENNKKKKLVINEEICVKCGACVMALPNQVEWQDSDVPVVVNEEVTDETEANVGNCPTGALHIEEN